MIHLTIVGAIHSLYHQQHLLTTPLTCHGTFSKFGGKSQRGVPLFSEVEFPYNMVQDWSKEAPMQKNQLYPSSFDTILACDGQTDRWTHNDSKY